MVGIRKTTDAHLKSMLSRQTDRARLAYGYFREDVDRQFVIWGTINVENNYLYDVTGNRRYWPIKVGKIDIVKFKEDLDQLWAEAVHLEKTDVSIRLDPKLWDTAAAEQAERSVSDPWLDILRDTIGDLDGKILNKDVWTIVGMDGEKRGQDHNKRIGDAMKTLGFERKDNGLRFDGKKGKGYARGEGAAVEARIYVVRDRDEVAAAHTWEEANKNAPKRTHVTSMDPSMGIIGPSHGPLTIIQEVLAAQGLLEIGPPGPRAPTPSLWVAKYRSSPERP